jgi:hypothetical protein
MEALQKLSNTPDFADQDAKCRIPIEIGSFRTYWQKGVSPSSPPFIATASQGARYVLVYLSIARAVAVFERCGRLLTRRAVLTDPTEMLAVLPDRALDSEPEAKAASERQIDTLRKVLDIPADKELPRVSATMCSRIIDRVLTEKSLARMRAEIALCDNEVPQVPTLAHD